MPVVVEHLSHTYKDGSLSAMPALEDISLTIEAGEFLCIIGHTGSGKTTFVQHLNGLLLPDTGSVIVDGFSMADKKARRQIRALVGMVFQYPEYQLFAETVREDVGFGPKNMGLDEQEIDRRVRSAMELVGLDWEEFAEKSPFELSGGEKRRAALAGIIAMEPRYIVLDEPMAGLDPGGRREILQMLERLRQDTGCAVIMVSHSMDDVAAHAQRVLVLDKGKMVYLDTPERVFAHGRELRQMGLSLPEASRLSICLREKGLQVPEGLYTMDRMEKWLLEVLP